MTLATTYSRAAIGIEAPLVSIEVHLGNGLPAFHIVGLPEKAVQESRERVRSALVNVGFEFPARRITVNLAPADLPKQGSRFDLGIAAGILAASGQLPDERLAEYEFIGELNLAGSVRPVSGVLPAALAASRDHRALFLANGNIPEASLVRESRLLPLQDLLALHGHLSGQQPIQSVRPQTPADDSPDGADFRDVIGQQHAKRALLIAATGGHNLLFSGPPGTGKSMLASRLTSILPPLSEREAVETAAIRSICNQPVSIQRWRQRPFRAPHHTASAAALVGGGNPPRPGEISLAHHGVLFLDELPEFPRRVLDVLREPMETGEIAISRAAQQATFPANFQLLAAMNPCPCGYLGDPRQGCHCTREQVSRYQARISGPLLDRIDLQIRVPPPDPGRLSRQTEDGESSAILRARVTDARRRQIERQGKTNRHLQGKALNQHCALDAKCRRLLEVASEKLQLSPRGYHRILRVARSIADLADSDRIEREHLAEAITYRSQNSPLSQRSGQE